MPEMPQTKQIRRNEVLDMDGSKYIMLCSTSCYIVYDI